MTKREKFINFVNELMEEAWPDIDSEVAGKEKWKDALEFFEDLKNNKTTNSKEMTENGAKLLFWMQSNRSSVQNLFTSKEAAEALFTSGRSIAGVFRKLVNDGYVEKVGKNPVQYSLTEKGIFYQIDK